MLARPAAPWRPAGPVAEAFGEPIVDRHKEVTSFRAPALTTPETGETAHRDQFQELCALTPRDANRATKGRFRGSHVV